MLYGKVLGSLTVHSLLHYLEWLIFFDEHSYPCKAVCVPFLYVHSPLLLPLKFSSPPWEITQSYSLFPIELHSCLLLWVHLCLPVFLESVTSYKARALTYPPLLPWPRYPWNIFFLNFKVKTKFLLFLKNEYCLNNSKLRFLIPQ